MADSREARTFASEIKFIVTPDLGALVREWARTHLEPDPYGSGVFGDEYRTASLYFDTASYAVFHRTGSFGRAKYRIRRYTDSDVVFLERKLRKPGIVVKRRTRTPLSRLEHLGGDARHRDWAGDWFHRRLLVRGLRPVCQISYHRMARGMLLDGASVRLTLDDSVRVAPVETTRFSLDPDVHVLDDRLILELKFRGHVPGVFRRLIEEFRLSPQTASKYRFGMRALGYVSRAEGPSALVVGDAHV